MTLLRWALLFFLISIVAGILGFTGVSAASADIARILFYIFAVIFLVLLILGLTIFRVLIEDAACEPLLCILVQLPHLPSEGRH